MARLATSEFLKHLKSLYPLKGGLARPVIRDPWYLVAAVAFSASNRPEEVPALFQYALEDLRKENQGPDDARKNDRLTLARRMRECLFQGGLLCGYARVCRTI